MSELNQEEIQALTRRETDRILTAELAEIKAELRAVRGLLERVVRVEERLASATESSVRLQAQLNEVFDRLRVVETSSATSRQSVGNMERFGWIAVTAIVATIVGYVSGGKH